MKGHLGFVCRSGSFSLGAYAYTSDATVSATSSVTTIKVWAVGGGGSYQPNHSNIIAGSGGGVAYKSWSNVPGRQLYITFSDRNARVDYGSQFIQGNNQTYGPTFIAPFLYPADGNYDSILFGSGTVSTATIGWAGALGTNPDQEHLRQPVVPGYFTNSFDEQAMMDAAAAAGLKVVEDNDPAAPAFGSGGYWDATGNYGGGTNYLPPGYGGGFAGGGGEGGAPIVLVKFE